MDPIIEEMARCLAYNGTDLGDERACILALISERYRAQAIEKCLDAVIDRARALRVKRETPLFMMRDRAAAIAVGCVGLVAALPARAAEAAQPLVATQDGVVAAMAVAAVLGVFGTVFAYELSRAFRIRASQRSADFIGEHVEQ